MIVSVDVYTKEVDAALAAFKRECLKLCVSDRAHAVLDTVRRRSARRTLWLSDCGPQPIRAPRGHPSQR